MTSQIDPLVIRDDQKVAKSDLRAQLEIAKNEITALQQQVSVPRRMAYEDSLFDSL